MTASIGDLVFEDLDEDGVFDADEVGLAGIVLRLLQDDNELATTTTDANGNYLFDELAAGEYTVELDTSSLGDLGLTTASTANVTLAEGEVDTTADFGVTSGEDAISEILSSFSGILSNVQFGAFSSSLPAGVEVVEISDLTIVNTGNRKLVFQNVPAGLGAPFGGVRTLGDIPADAPDEQAFQLADRFAEIQVAQLAGIGSVANLNDFTLHIVAAEAVPEVSILNPLAESDVVIAVGSSKSIAVGRVDYDLDDPDSRTLTPLFSMPELSINSILDSGSQVLGRGTNGTDFLTSATYALLQTFSVGQSVTQFNAMLSTAFPLVPVVDEPALTPAELSILQAITGGQGLIDQIANNASERNNFLVEARVVLDAHSRGLTNLVAGADVRTTGNVRTEADVVSDQEFIEVKNGDYNNAKKLSGRDLTQFNAFRRHLKQQTQGSELFFVDANGNTAGEVPVSSKWTYIFNSTKQNAELETWLKARGVDEVIFRGE
jgi:hypothetical protein